MTFSLVASISQFAEFESTAPKIGLFQQGIGYPQREIRGYENPQNQEIVAFSHLNQSPVAVNTPLQVNFGDPVSTDFASVDANGLITIIDPGIGVWAFQLFIALERGSNAGITETYLLPRKNGLPAGNPLCVKLRSLNITIPFAFIFTDTAVRAGDTYTLEFYNDDTNGGNNDAALVSNNATVYGLQSASASLRLFRYFAYPLNYVGA